MEQWLVKAWVGGGVKWLEFHARQDAEAYIAKNIGVSQSLWHTRLIAIVEDDRKWDVASPWYEDNNGEVDGMSADRG